MIFTRCGKLGVQKHNQVRGGPSAPERGPLSDQGLHHPPNVGLHFAKGGDDLGFESVLHDGDQGWTQFVEENISHRCWIIVLVHQ